MTAAVASFHRTTRLALRLALVVVATFCVLRGIGYSDVFGPEQVPEGVQIISAFVPLHVWGWLWCAAGFIALLAIIPCWPAGSLACVVMCLMWAVGYTVSFTMAIGNMIDHTTGPLPPGSRDYLSASVYWTVLLLLACGYLLASNALRLSRTRTP